MPDKPESPLLEPTPDIVAEIRAMIAAADHAALATVEPHSHWPMASRVGLTTDPDGTPAIIASALTPHFAAFRAEPRCGLLIGEPGRGDPLAHPRVMLACRAVAVAPGSAEAAALRARYLAKHPKAVVYVDLPDFRFFRLEIVRARYNAGFGRAYEIAGATLSGPPGGPPR